MLATFLNLVQTVHAGLILYLTLEIYQYPNIDVHLHLAIAQAVLTLIQVLFVRRSLDIIPLILSASLFTSLLPPVPIQTDWIPILFLGKIVYINDILSGTKNLLFSGDNCSFCRLGGIIYNFIRFTVTEYLFLGIVISIYKGIVLHFDMSVQQLPQNYVLFYQMMVTATTIGYGDVCPKSRIQMNFFSCAIPFVIGSFIIYGNNVNPLWDEFMAFMKESSQDSSSQLFDLKSMSKQQKDNLNEFHVLSAQKRVEQQNLKQTYFNDWISIAAVNYEKQAQLINTIVDVTVSKQAKLIISSKIRQQFFPKDWVIVDSNDINEEIFMIIDGEIDINGEIKSSGFIFNQKGFFCQAISDDKVVAKTFVSVWSVNLKDLEELATNYPSVREKINFNIKMHCE